MNKPQFAEAQRALLDILIRKASLVQQNPSLSAPLAVALRDFEATTDVSYFTVK